MPEYLYLIHPMRHEFFDSPTPREQAVMEEHFSYLKQALEQGTLILAGPCLDATFGLVVLAAQDEDRARAFMLNDPCVRHNVMVAELHPLRISLGRR